MVFLFRYGRLNVLRWLQPLFLFRVTISVHLANLTNTTTVVKNPVENLALLGFTVDDNNQPLLPIGGGLLQSLKLAAQKRFLNPNLSLFRLSESRIERKGLKVVKYLEIVALSPLQPSCNSCLGGPGMMRGLFSS